MSEQGEIECPSCGAKLLRRCDALSTDGWRCQAHRGHIGTHYHADTANIIIWSSDLVEAPGPAEFPMREELEWLERGNALLKRSLALLAKEMDR